MARLDIRTTEEIKTMLDEISKLEGRSMTKELEQLIKERYDKLKGSK